MTIKPFTLSISQSEVEDLRRRLHHARFPQMIDGADWERGVPEAYLREVATHWEETFDWKRQQAVLNHYPQFTADIEGQTIHFFHIQSEDQDAMPMLSIHGWPSSNVEYLKVFDLLTRPKQGKSFHVIAPTIPEFGRSKPVTEIGWYSPRTANAFTMLKKELGCQRSGVTGSDIGAHVSGELVKVDSENIIGTHMATDT